MYYWKIFRNRKNEAQRKDLPKPVFSQVFDTIVDAQVFAEHNKANWLQATLYDKTNPLKHTIFCVCKTDKTISYNV